MTNFDRTPLVFDGHNDLLSRLWCAKSDPVATFCSEAGQVNAAGIAQGGFGGGFFALYSPAKRTHFDFTNFRAGDFDIPLPPPLDQAKALASVIAQIGIARQLEAAGHLRLLTTGPQLAAAMEDYPMAGLLHLEGADCIGPELLELDALHAAGLRSLGPVWSRPTIFGEGVPFRYGQDGDTGPGLTQLGRALVARCRDLGIIVDTSHLTLRGFWDVAETGLPLVATHSNAYALCQATRNLTDDQLRGIAQTKGMAGLNFGTVFLDEAGWKTGRSTLEACIRQLDHMIATAGEDRVGLGSDFDGAPMPDGLESAAALGNLRQEMDRAGYGAALIDKLCHGNWLAFLTRMLP